MVRTKPPKKKRKLKKTKLTSEQKEQNDFRSEVRSIFTQSGFIKIPTVSDKEFTFDSATGDFDDIFSYENIIVLAEYTISQSSNISDHLKKKKILFDKILSDQSQTIDFFKSKFSKFKERISNSYHKSQFKIKIIYASKNTVDIRHKRLVPDVVYFDYQYVKYFSSVVSSVKKSAMNELLSFLNFNRSDIGNSDTACSKIIKYKGSILPEAHSFFDDGYKVVSFYIDPETLLEKSYVLRKDGWRDRDALYQRMISKSKVESIRKYLRNKKRVFINNIVITLPPTTKLLNEDDTIIDCGSISQTKPVIISFPDEFNTIGIIDGQHRVFAYHEGGSFDNEISVFRKMQNLLVTGIIYPENVKAQDVTMFEATLFLEINSNQTNAKSDLKQAIGLLLTPFAPASIGRNIINRLNETTPFLDLFERYFYDTHKIKTTSIVSYALVPLVKLHGNDSFYKLWNNQNKDHLLLEEDDKLLNEYIEFCAGEIRKLFIAIRMVISKSDVLEWSYEKKDKGRFLTTTNINGFLICLRRLVKENKTGTIEYYRDSLKRLDSFPFHTYHSSQYGRMAKDLYNNFFNLQQ